MRASSGILLLLDRDPFPSKLTAHMDHTRIEIDVRPGETERLAASQPECEREPTRLQTL